MITKIEGNCQYEDCNKLATMIAVGRAGYGMIGRVSHATPGCYCDEHAIDVAEEGSPEYHHDCPNCGCLSGVN